MNYSDTRYEFEVTWLDTYLFWLEHYFSLIVMHIFILSLSGFVFFGETVLRKEPRTTLAGLIAAAMVYFSLWIFQFLFTALFISKGKNRSSICSHVVVLGDEELLEETPLNRSFFKWQGIPQVKNYFSCLAIYTQQHGAIIIPNRTFADKIEKNSIYCYL